jgi:predicted anti-sigma-YlaC factor YlaD
VNERQTSTNDHERARMLLALADAASLAAAECAWLEKHLESCEPCRTFSQNTGDLVRALRSVPLAADRTLVITTQWRVRQRARELRQRQERMWLVGLSCVLVTLTAVLSNLAFVRGFGWLVEHSHISAGLLPVVFVGFWIVPVLAASVLFLAHGTHLADHSNETQV